MSKHKIKLLISMINQAIYCYSDINWNTLEPNFGKSEKLWNSGYIRAMNDILIWLNDLTNVVNELKN